MGSILNNCLTLQPTRMSVFPPSHLHLEVLNGKDETIDFEDVLNGTLSLY